MLQVFLLYFQFPAQWKSQSEFKMQQVLQALEPSHLLDFLQDVLSSELAKKELFKDAFLQVFLASTQLCLIVIFLAYFG